MTNLGEVYQTPTGWLSIATLCRCYKFKKKEIKSNTQYNEKTLYSLQVYCLRYVKIK